MADAQVPQYPNARQIRPEWSRFQTIMLVVVSVALFAGIGFLHSRGLRFTASKWLSLAGLYVDLIGVLIASMRTPYFGRFHDSGLLERKRIEADNKPFMIGMMIVAAGLFLQALGTLVPDCISALW